MSLYKRTLWRKNFIKHIMNYNFVEIWECEYSEWIKDKEKYLSEASIMPPHARHHRGGLTEEQILQAVKKEELYGFIEVDIKVIISQFVSELN